MLETVAATFPIPLAVVEDAADPAAVVAAAHILDREISRCNGAGVFLHAGAAAKNQTGAYAAGSDLVAGNAPRAVILLVGASPGAAARRALLHSDEAVLVIVAVIVGPVITAAADGAAGPITIVIIGEADVAPRRITVAGELVLAFKEP